MSHLHIKTAFNLDLEFECAPILLRFGAQVIDVVVVCLYLYFISKIDALAWSEPKEADLGMVLQLLLSAPVFFYHLGCEILFNGQSVGKKILKLRVISIDGTAPSSAQYLLRWMCNPSGFILVGILMIIFMGGIFSLMFLLMYATDFFLVLLNKYGQRLGDLAAATIVVTEKLPYSLQDTIYIPVDITTYQVKYPEVTRLSDRDINTINNVLLQYNKYKSQHYVGTLVGKIESVLQIKSTEDDLLFLYRLLSDYNYLTQKD
jgi:uncharacterized RDD family membrane protein YckC